MELILKNLFFDERRNFFLIKRCLVESLPSLLARGFVSALDEITDIFLLGGESHDGNKNVVLFYVHGKPSFALKLRSVDLEHNVSEFLRCFFQEKCNIHDWDFPEYISGNGYGWVKWCSQNSLKNVEEVKRFYRLSGYLIAAVASLGITDLHYENIVVHNGKPIPIDLEAAFHHVPPYAPATNIPRTNLTPNIIKYTAGVADIEHAGLGNIFRKDAVLNASLNTNPNAVILENIVQSPITYLNEIISGCEECYDCILDNKHVFISFVKQSGVLENRAIVRDTANYCLVIEASLHPLLLISNKARREYIERCLNINNEYRGGGVLRAEVDACFLCDVPRFTSAVNSIVVKSFHSPDAIPLENYVSGYDYALEYLNGLNSHKVSQELNFLRSVYVESGKLVELHAACFEEGDGNNVMPMASESMLSVLRNLMRDSAREFISSTSAPLVFTSQHENYLEFRQVGLDLFSGVGGLGYLASKGLLFDDVYEDQEFVDVYSKFILEGDFLSSSPLGGAYVGALCSLAPCLIAKQTSFYSEFSAKIFTNFNAGHYTKLGAGLVSGIAGALVMTSCYYKITSAEVWRDISIALFKELELRSQCNGSELIFVSEISNHPKKCLSGLSHGQAGIAYSLAVYGLVFDDYYDRCSEIIQGVIEFEINSYEPVLKNWPDFRCRPRSVESHHDFSWAHGGAGVILVLDFISKHFKLDNVHEFEVSHDYLQIFEFNLDKESAVVNRSVANGMLGAELIYKKLYTELSRRKVFYVPQGIYESSSYGPVLGYGLFKGCAGEYLAFRSLQEERQLLPLLTHELFDIEF